MRTHGLSIVVAAIALMISVPLEAQAQEAYTVRPLVEILSRHRPVNAADHSGRTEKTTEALQQVQENINRHQMDVARLRAEGKTEAAIRRMLTPLQMPAATGSVTGRIYESDGVTPVSGFMAVNAYDRFGRYSGYGYTLYADGVYTIEDLATGEYYVQLNSSGASDAIPVYYDDVIDWRQATLVHVADGQQTAGIDFIVRQYHGAIAGAVCSVDSIALTDCSVGAYDLEGDWVRSVATDSLGNFVVGGLLTGSYKLEAGAWGTGDYLPQWFDGATSFETATIVQVVEPETTRGKDFFLQESGGHGAITCVFVPAQGDTNPVGYWDVRAWDEEMNQTAGIVNYDDGSVTIPRLPTGSYKVSYSCFGATSYLDGWYDQARDVDHATPVQVVAPETTHISIALQRGGAIAGKVSFACPTGIAIIVYDENRAVVRETTSEEGGTYVVLPLPPGRYKVRASSIDSYTFPCSPDVMDQWYSQAMDFEHATFVDVPGTDTTRDINFALSTGGVISCRVVGPGGLAVTDGRVYLCDVRGAVIRSERAGFDGFFSFGGLLPGQYRLHYGYSGEAGYASEWYNGKSSSLDAAVININTLGSIQNITFSLERAGTLGGFVTDNAGTRLTESDHFIQVILYDAETGGYVGSTGTSFVGGFRGTLLPGSYKVGVFAANYNTLSKPDSLAVMYYEHGKMFTDSAATAVEVGQDASLLLNDCVMQRAPGGITGTVFDRSTGDPVTSGTYLIMAFDEQSRPVAVSGYTSDPVAVSGTYELRGLWPGQYWLLAVAGTGSSGGEYCKWYDDIDVDVDSVMHVPMPSVPPTARSVVVGTGVTAGIDFRVGPVMGVATEPSARAPEAFCLNQNYPNPFNPITTIRCGLPERSHVTLTVFNLLGQQVATLVEGEMEAGYHEVRFDASTLSSGVYLYRLTAGDYIQIRKLILLR